MCGFVGFMTANRYHHLRGDLQAATDALSHRGPDDHGYLVDQTSGVGFGHRRLSILDLSSAGRQPMRTQDKSLSIVYNGEIYNYREIRSTLQVLGYVFKTGTDTEVVLKAYQAWGVDCVHHFIGMFAIAIWDKNKNRLFLARDRLGIKPLYYYQNHETLIFSSELKAIMTFSAFPKRLNYQSLSLFLHYQYIPAPRTIFEHTWKLEPGHFILFDGHCLQNHVYWRLPLPGAATQYGQTREEEAVHKLDDLLTQAVRDRLISDVPVGALLSGGIDSSLVTALMQKTNASPVKTFTIGFKDEKYNEAPWAEKIASHLGTKHTQLFVDSSEALNIISKLPSVYDEPFADSSAIPTYLVSWLTRQNVTVALSGDGGDEQFAGYVRYWMTGVMADVFGRFPLHLRRYLSQMMMLLPSKTMGRVYQRLCNHLPRRFQVSNFDDKWRKLIMLTNQTQLSELYRTTVCLWSRDSVEALTDHCMPDSTFDRCFETKNGVPAISKMMYSDLNTYLPDCMLTKVDRASMANSLEIRVPLLDHRVVEYVAALPEKYKYRNGTGKYLLKKVLSRYVPAKLFERPKMGFGAPMEEWLRNDLKELLCDYLSKERLKAEGLFNQDIVSATIQDHLSRKNNHHHRLWALVSWQMWRERWLS